MPKHYNQILVVEGPLAQNCFRQVRWQKQPFPPLTNDSKSH